jgi:hypothetical protein
MKEYNTNKNCAIEIIDTLFLFIHISNLETNYQQHIEITN